MGYGASERQILEKKLEQRLQDPKTEPLIPLPLDFLEDITCGFSTERVLGEGGYGVVYKGVLRSFGKAIAVKKIRDEHLLGNQVENEIICLTEVRHQNVVQLVGYCVQTKSEVMEHSGKHVMVEKRACLLCFEFLCNGSLDKHLSDDTLGLDWDIRYEIIRGVCRGLHYLHDECHIVHLDLKPQNILMDATMMLKIADFGLSRLLGEQNSKTLTKTLAGTPGYMAPEYIDRGIISPKADIFSLGVIIIEIITGQRDYPNIGERTETSLEHYTDKVVGSWRNRLKIIPMHMSLEMHIQQVEQCISVALRCLEPDLNKRPTSLDIVHILNAEKPTCISLGKHPIFAEKGFRKVDPDRWEFANEGFFGMPQAKLQIPPVQNATNQQSLEGFFEFDAEIDKLKRDKALLMAEVVKLRQEQLNTMEIQKALRNSVQGTEQRQQQMMAFLARGMQNPEFLKHLIWDNEMRRNEPQDAISIERRGRIDQGPEVNDLGSGSNLEQGSPVLFNPQDSVKFLVDGIPTDLESPTVDGQGLIVLQDIDIGSTSEQQQDIPQELNDNLWEELLNEGHGEENDSPVIEDDV